PTLSAPTLSAPTLPPATGRPVRQVTRGGAAVAAHRAGAAVAARLPAAWCRDVAEGVAAVAVRAPRMAGRREMAARHLQRVHGGGLGRAELARLTGDCFASYARYWAESLRLPGLGAAEVDAGFACRGLDHLEAAAEAGRGAILALPHLGGWEWGGTWLVHNGYRVTVVVEPLQPPALFDWFSGVRRRLGMEVVAVGPAAGRQALAALRENSVLCLLCDRLVGGAAGVEVEFFGERTRLPAGPVTLALRSGAALLPAAVYFGAGADAHVGVVRPPVPVARTARLRDDVVEGTQRLAAELEGLIRRAPTQWHILQPNWPSDRQAAPVRQRARRRAR
ncbi:MAG: phosphatidylinositol mannoside acyltransferase, partial [Acidimicrobiales bacterium]